MLSNAEAQKTLSERAMRRFGASETPAKCRCDTRLGAENAMLTTDCLFLNEKWKMVNEETLSNDMRRKAPKRQRTARRID